MSLAARYRDLWDWRRRISELYAAVREASDPAAGWALWRQERDALFRSHPSTPLDAEQRAGFTGLGYFNYDPRWRLLVDLEEANAEPELLSGGEDGDVSLVPFARTAGLGPPLGRELTLYWIAGYGGGVFLPFKDGTAGRSSFGGGRYLLDTIKGTDLGAIEDGRIVLDFNFAYNPSCAYSPRWICPLSPAANTVSAAIEAGEMTPG